MKNKKTLLSILAKHEKNLIVYQHMVSSSNENKNQVNYSEIPGG